MSRMPIGNMVRSAVCCCIGGVVAFGVGGCSGPGPDPGRPVASDISTGSDAAPPVRGGAPSCVAPRLEVDPTTIAPGDTVEVHGMAYFDGCADALENGAALETSTPKTGVPLVMVSGTGTSEEIVRLDADDLFEIEYSLTIPPSVPAGTLTLRLGDAEPVAVTVTP